MLRCPQLNIDIGEKGPMEAGSHCTPHIPHYTGIAIHGQDIAQLCQSIWLPGSFGPQGQRVQLSLCKLVLSVPDHRHYLAFSTTFQD